MSGIYRIVNKTNGKVYIGSTNRNFSYRKSSHFCELRDNRHGNSHLQRSYNKYGKEDFVFEIVEKCKGEDALVERELYWYNQYHKSQRYNQKEPTSRFGGRMSRETKEKIRQSMLENPPFKGRKHTKESKEQMSNSKKGTKSKLFGVFGKDHPSYGSKRTEEEKRAMSERRMGEGNSNYGRRGQETKNAKAINQIDMKTGEVLSTYGSVVEAAEALGKRNKSANIGRCANGKYKHSCGYKWEWCN